MSKIPVLLVAFNRPEHVSEAMKAIREYKPERLYLECDGARPDRQGEFEAVQATRKAMLDAIDWDCMVKTLFRNENLGCAEAVNDGISWFFEYENCGIICEDDVILSQDFFKFCEDLLPRYEDEEKIMEISARNESLRTDVRNTYVYSQCFHCWGWATWKRAWSKMDMQMNAAKRLSFFYLIKRLGLFRGIMMKHYFMSGFKSLPYYNSWATRWYLSILADDGLVLCPGVNLALNIGFDGGAHYNKGDHDPLEKLELGQMDWPLSYNDVIKPDIKQTLNDSYVFFMRRMVGVKKKFRNLLHRTNSLTL